MPEQPVDTGIIRLGGGFSEYDRHLIGNTLNQLLSRIATSDRVWDLELSVKDRENPGQYVTLEARAGRESFVATSQLENMRDALNDVGSDVLRQFDRARDRSTPRSNRHRRDSIRSE